MQLSSLLSCLARSRHRFCFLLERRMFKVACLVFLAVVLDFVDNVFLFEPRLPYIQPGRRTLYCVWVFGKFFSSSIVVSLAKPNHCLLKTPAIFLRVLSQNFRQYFCYRNSSNLIGSCWFLLCF